MNTKLLFLLFITNIVLGQNIDTLQNNNQKHIGKWTGVDIYGKKAVLELDAEKYVYFNQNGETYGGKDFNYKGKTGTYKYEIDYSKNPIRIDFILFRDGIEITEKHNRGIIRFINDNKIEIRFLKNTKYPTRFKGKNDKTSLILERIQ